MDDQSSISRLGAGADGAAKSIDALTASLSKLSGNVPATSAGEKAFQTNSGGAGGGAALEKAQQKIDESAAKTAMDRLKIKQKNELKAIEGHESAITKLKKVHQKERFAVVKEAAEATLSEVSGNLETIAGRYKAFGGVAKAAMMADATMKTYNSAIGAYDQAMSLPRPFGLIMAPISAALAVGAGMVNVSKIAGQKFEQGGAVIGPSHAMGGVAAELEGGEYVVPRRTVNKMGGFQAVEGTLGMASARKTRVSSTINISVGGNAGGGQPAGAPQSGGRSLIGTMRAHQNKSRLAGAYRITG